jgi:hypothetical protein
MAESRDESTEDLLSSRGSEPLVPILWVDDGQADPVALSTWHQALSNTLSVEVPHDLLGLWLYPAHGGPVLLGPAELAADTLELPTPGPRFKPEQLSRLEAIVLKAGYGSVSCIAVGFAKRDVGLMLAADLRPDRYGSLERVVLQCVGQKLGPMLGRMARQWKSAEESPEGAISRQQERIAGLLETVAHANQDSSTPRRFIATISRGLAPLLPHDHLELLVADGSNRRFVRLSELDGGSAGTDPDLAISEDHLNVAGLFGAEPRLLMGDTYQDERWPRGLLTASEPAGADLRSLVGARMNLRNNVSAYLLAGSVGPELYGSEDAELLGVLAGLITPQVGGFMQREDPCEPAVRSAEGGSHADQLFRIAGLLATTSDPAVATQLIAAEAKAIFPFEKLTFALRMTQTDRVALLEPGEKRTLASLPLISVAGTALARTLRGDLPCAFVQHGGESRMMVPLRVAGRVYGALMFTARAPDELNEQHVLPAQHLADIVAAHLELLRRGAMMPQPSVPRWASQQRTAS